MTQVTTQKFANANRHFVLVPDNECNRDLSPTEPDKLHQQSLVLLAVEPIPVDAGPLTQLALSSG
jgi:hypothetical protein